MKRSPRSPDDTPLSPAERVVDVVVEETKRLGAPELDWAKLEARVMKEISEPSRPAKAAAVVLIRPPHAVRSRPEMRDSKGLRFAAIALAVAAGFLVVVRRDPEPIDPSILAPEPTAGSLRGTEGVGDVRVAGLGAVTGQTLRGGDLIEADGTRAIFERPRKVTWLLEREGGGVGRARVKSAADALVLDLEDGSIEAQVVAVPCGEAFAVDIGTAEKTVRIAVHGTHFRVTRSGSRVVVDLSEGVVSIGVPPRTGSTYGTLVTAPAHVELDATDLDATLKVDHVVGAVRQPIVLPHVDAPVALARDAPLSASNSRSHAVDGMPLLKPDSPSERPNERSDRPKAAIEGRRLSSRDAVLQAVKDCAVAKGAKGNNVKVTLTSTLSLKVTGAGEVQSAVFDPPLQPEIQSCAAAAIYRFKLDETGLVSLPLDLSY